MWIKRSDFDRQHAQIEQLHSIASNYFTLIQERDREIATLRAQVLDLTRRFYAGDKDVEKKLAAAQAYNDVYKTRINELAGERATLLAKVAQMPVMAAQIAEPSVGLMPGTDFNDMGDEAAKMHGYADEIPVDLTPVGDVS